MAKPQFCGLASPLQYQPEECTNSWRRRGLPNLPCPKSPRSSKEHGSISRGRRVGSIRCEPPPKHIRCSLQGQKSPNLLPHQHELVDDLNRMCSGDVAHPSITRQCITYQCPPDTLLQQPERAPAPMTECLHHQSSCPSRRKSIPRSQQWTLWLP